MCHTVNRELRMGPRGGAPSPLGKRSWSHPSREGTCAGEGTPDANLGLSKGTEWGTAWQGRAGTRLLAFEGFLGVGLSLP